MPKPGYASITIANWMIPLLRESGDSPPKAIKQMLQRKFGESRLKRERKKWSEKYYGSC